MKRLKVLFALIILMIAMPVWRSIDMVVILSPIELLVSLALTIWFAVFFAIPLKLIIPKIKTPILLGVILAFGVTTFSVSHYSAMATERPELRHCGIMTFTGAAYNLRGILTDAYRDDLEVRNQMCWIRKLISRVPTDFENPGEMEMFSKITRDKLMKPEIKYRACLPVIAVLNYKISAAALKFAVGPKEVYDSVKFWETHYTDEIRYRKYPGWNWPHSDYIKWEYGFIEENWQSLIDNISITSN